MSDGGRGRASLGVEVRNSSQKWSAQRSAVRSIAWLGLLYQSRQILSNTPSGTTTGPSFGRHSLGIGISLDGAAPAILQRSAKAIGPPCTAHRGIASSFLRKVIK